MITESIVATRVPDWEVRLPWLRAGTTRRTGETGAVGAAGGAAGGALGETRPDCPAGELGEAPPDCPAGGAVRALLADGWRSLVRSRQVHGALTHVHTELPRGQCLAADGDGHVTRTAGILLAVTLADCVPVFVADPARRTVALLHAGWRGTAAGVLERGLSAMHRAFGSEAPDLFVHLGPAICGGCYEVGPEVFRALGEASPEAPAPIDLRAVLLRRALAAGVTEGRLTVSDECTRCGDGRYFSHRRGDTGRHLGFIGILPRAGAQVPKRASAAATGGRGSVRPRPEAGR